MFGDSNKTLTIDLGEMEYGRPYTVVIGGDLQDTSGNPMGGDYSFSFTTATGESKRPTSTIVVPETVQAGSNYTLQGTATGYTWERDPDNPLELIHYDTYGNITGDTAMLHPTVLYFPNGVDGYRFYLIYTPYPEEADENPCLMRSNDGVNFTAVGVDNPLFIYNTQPVYDSQTLADPDAIKVGNTWALFYEMEQAQYGHIGVALSDDGLKYTPYGGPYSPARTLLPYPEDGNPILHFGDTEYDQDSNPGDIWPRLGEPAAIFKDGVFHLWYTLYNSDAIAMHATASEPTGPWTKLGPAVYGAAHSDVVYDPERDLYVMWYLDGDYNSIATAPDPGGPWTTHPENPVFGPAGGWEDAGLYRSSLVEVGTQWYMYYSANPGYNGKIGLAREVPGIRSAEISTDGGASWTDLPVDAEGNWSYSWTPTSTGERSVQVRVTDDWMVGDPARAIVTVE